MMNVPIYHVWVNYVPVIDNYIARCIQKLMFANIVSK